MTPSRHQYQRFEYKFRLAPEQLEGVRRFVRGFLVPDEFSAAFADSWYPVHSLYLDSEERHLRSSTVVSQKNRYKLRVRYYDDHASSPAFLEIKRRVNSCVVKHRAAVHRWAVAPLCQGELPERSMLLRNVMEDWQVLIAFYSRIRELNAVPAGRVSYDREAWTSGGDQAVRVTFDRDVRFVPCETTRLETSLAGASEVFPGEHILELKFTRDYPAWFRDLEACFRLHPESAGKYVEGALHAELSQRLAPAISILSPFAVPQMLSA